MRNVSKLVILVLLTSIGFISCSEDTPVIEPVSATITANFGEAFANKAIEGVTVKLSGVSNGSTYTAQTDAAGEVKFGSVNPGVYNISATIEFTKAQYLTFFGTAAAQDKVNFSGAKDNISIQKNSPNHSVELKTSRIGDLLFKQIYYAGSDLREGAGFRDMFVEIYNNSNETIYADGLYFGQLYGRISTSVKAYTLANGQYDWTKSIGQTKGAKSNTDYVYADHVYKIPGTGKQHPIKAGESIVIAATGINHKQPLVVGGKTYSVNNPALTIDLSGAQFEVNLIAHLNSIGKTPLDTDIDNPTIPNMEVAYHLNAREMILDPLGRDSFVIFRTKDFASLERLPNPQTTTITATTRKYLQIPNSDIIDAVETNRPDPARRFPRRLDASLDAGVASVAKGHYSSQAVIRKVAQTFGGRKVLQDTNNSDNDFSVIDVPVPGGWK